MDLSISFYMFYSPRLFLRDWWIAAPILGVFFSQLFIWWDIIANIRPSGEQFFLHYNMILGVDLVGEWWKIYLFPVVGLLIFIINYAVAFLFYNNDKFLSRLLSVAAGIVHIFLIAAVIWIVRLNA